MTQGLAAGFTREGICSDQSKAGDIAFSAKDWMPYGTGVSEGEGWSDEDNVDSESIMLYPSKAGGAGQATLGNDHRATILQGWKASDHSEDPDDRAVQDFGAYFLPSGRDVKGIKYLYSEDSGWGDDPVELIQVTNRLNAQFEEATHGAHCR